MAIDENTLDLDKIGKSVIIENINPETKFWMVRTKKGFFYNEFIEDEFVALGWNIIDNETLKNTCDDEEREKVKEDIEHKYKSKQGTQVLNKCIRFIEEMKVGDILMIPSRCNDEIAFAIVGEYFEVDTFDYEKEIEVISQIDSKVDYGIDIKCPYKKRRRIEIVKKINGERLNPNLYKVLASYHGISNINGYANYILSSIYSIYYWEYKLNVVFNVEQEKDIGAKAFSSFIYNTSSLIDYLDNDMYVSAKANLNSPGDLILALQSHANQAFDILSSHKMLLSIVGVWMLVVGGKLGPIEFKSLAEIIIKYREQNSKLKTDELDRELKEIQIEKGRRELKEIEKHLEEIKASSDSLKINKDDANNVIDLVSYRQQKDD